MIFVTSQAPSQRVRDYYAGIGLRSRLEVLDRLTVVEVPDETARTVGAKLLDRPDLIARIRDLDGDRPAVIEPWNVSEVEVSVAQHLGVPIQCHWMYTGVPGLTRASEMV